jgi:hypothetical protein
MVDDELEDLWCGSDEALGKFGERSATDDHQQEDSVRNNGRELVRLVSNSRVMRHRDPSLCCNCCEPSFVGAVRRKVIRVTLDVKAGVAKNGGKLYS